MSRNSLPLAIRPRGGWPLRSSRGLLAATLTLLSGGFQLAVAFRVDLLLTPRQHVPRRDVSGGTVQADIVVMLHVAFDQTPRIFQRQWRSRPNAFAFQRLVPALDLAVRLWIVRGRSDVRHARDANELLEVASDELRTIVRDDSRLRFRVLLLGSLGGVPVSREAGDEGGSAGGASVRLSGE